MFTMGIDIGSTTSKCAILRDDKEIVAISLIDGGIGTYGPEAAMESVLKNAGLKQSEIHEYAATGYGRNLYAQDGYNVSELSCHALGAHWIFPEVRTIIDIGGQDAKVIRLDAAGRMENFVMNDKCAAGTGRFLDVMANVLKISVEEMSEIAACAEEPVNISNTCTVFAESEIISRLAKGVCISDLIAGINLSVAGRVAALAKRIGIIPEVCMSGGVALNSGVRMALSEYLQVSVRVSEYAQFFGAIGGAIYAYNKKQRYRDRIKGL